MRSLDTRAVHGGQKRDPEHASVATPIVLSSTFDYPELPGGEPSPYIYTRYANPTIEAAEARIAALEGTTQAVLFSSGMAAIAATVLSVAKTGDTILASPILYGGTRDLFDHELARLGIRVQYLDDDTLFGGAPLPDAPGAVMLYLESPTNPMLRVLDVPALTARAKERGLTVVVDNTFAGPALARPSAWGVDLVMESATKSLGGHSDLIGGVVAGSSDLMDRVWLHRKRWGGNADPSAAYRLLRGLPTLPLRVQRTGETAAALAEALSAEPWTTSVHHPSLGTHPDHAVAARTLDGPIGLVTFAVQGGDAAAVRLRRRLRVVRPAASLGGVETLLSLPFETSQAGMTPESRRAIGIPDGAVRMAVGLESFDDILDDLRQAASQ